MISYAADRFISIVCHVHDAIVIYQHYLYISSIYIIRPLRARSSPCEQVRPSFDACISPSIIASNNIASLPPDDWSCGYCQDYQRLVRCSNAHTVNRQPVITRIQTRDDTSRHAWDDDRHACIIIMHTAQHISPASKASAFSVTWFDSYKQVIYLHASNEGSSEFSFSCPCYSVKPWKDEWISWMPCSAAAWAAQRFSASPRAGGRHGTQDDDLVQ